MDPNPLNLGALTAASKRLARRLLTIGENRLELLAVELQEERERLLRAILLALGAAVLALLTGAVFTTLLIVLFWGQSAVAVLLTLIILYGSGAVVLHWRLLVLLREWQNFPATLDQLRKDRACLEDLLS